ncbi:MAG TPA: hypothetical protein VFS13_12445 [Steroidobacteraceae bacterium]|nr:hypothetical protein [Steroidobacteraceae bacterium]
MKRMLLLCLPGAFLIAPQVAWAADDARVVRLEQEVRTLQRDLLNLARQVDQLRLQSSRPSATGRPPPPPAVETGPAWLDARKWEKIRPGMAELDVLGLLGPPTSMREQDGARELLYAMEIGSSAFLGGSVLVRDRRVVEVRVPTLK